MAQLVEQLIRNQQVAGSSPATSSKKIQVEKLGFFVFYTQGKTPLKKLIILYFPKL